MIWVKLSLNDFNGYQILRTKYGHCVVFCPNIRNKLWSKKGVNIMEEIEYCEICGDALTDDDQAFEGLCDDCGDTE